MNAHFCSGIDWMDNDPNQHAHGTDFFRQKIDQNPHPEVKP
jgi:hypothetical protein